MFNKLRITNGLYEHKHTHKYTWEGKTKKSKLIDKSIVDYLILKERTCIEPRHVRVQRRVTLLIRLLLITLFIYLLRSMYH